MNETPITAQAFSAACWLEQAAAFYAANREALERRIFGRPEPQPEEMPAAAWKLYKGLRAFAAAHPKAAARIFSDFRLAAEIAEASAAHTTQNGWPWVAMIRALNDIQQRRDFNHSGRLARAKALSQQLGLPEVLEGITKAYEAEQRRRLPQLNRPTK